MPSPEPPLPGGVRGEVHLRGVRLRRDRFPTREHYPFDLPFLQSADRLTFGGPVTFFVGENGSGKSTLLEAVCRSCGIHIWKYQGGRRHAPNPYEERLHEAVEPEWTRGPVPGAFFAARIFQDFAELLDEWAVSDPGMFRYFGGSSLLTQSHGQSLLSYFRSRYRLPGLYLLDEPETALSPTSQIALLRTLASAGRQGRAQFLIATHSPILTACPGATIYSFDSVPPRTVRFEETEHYRIYRSFMADRGPFLEGMEEG